MNYARVNELFYRNYYKKKHPYGYFLHVRVVVLRLAGDFFSKPVGMGDGL